MPITRTPYFSPTSIGGCALWLDGADPAGTGTAPTNGTTVSTWVDKSGNARNAVASSGTATFQTNIQNSLGALLFSTQRYIVTYNSFPVSAYTFIILIYSTATSGYFISGPTDGFIYIGPRGGYFGTFTGNGTWNDTNANTPNISTTNTWVIGDMVISGSLLSPFVNGTAQNTKTGSTGAINSFSIGTHGTLNQEYFAGYAAEVLLYNTALTTSQRLQIEGYLAQKWGIQNQLPQDHIGRGAIIYRGVKVGTTYTPLYTQFSPRSIPGCGLWLDGADSSQITKSGSYITSIKEKVSGSVFTATGTTLTTSTINGVQSLNFPGTTYLSGAYTNPASAYLFIVFTVTSITNNAYSPFFNWKGPNDGTANIVGFGLTSGATVAPYQSDQGQQTPTYTVSLGSTYMMCFSFNGTATSLGINGQTPTSGTQPTPISAGSKTSAWICSDYNATTTVNIGELIVYNTSSLTTTQRQQVESYLAQKWGLTATLPTFSGPTSIPGCVLWLDGNDTSTMLFNGSAITQWNDKSASGNYVSQATVANAPTLGTSQNGLNTVYFATNNQQLVSSQNSATSGNASRTVILLFWCPTTSSAFYTVTGTEAGSTPPTAWGHCKNANADVDYPFLYSSSGTDTYAFVYSTPNPLLTYAQFDSASSTISSYYSTSGSGADNTIGNSTVKTSVTLNTTAGVWYIGKRQQNGTGSVTSHLLEMIQYNRVLTTTERQQVEGYLAAKWGIQAQFASSHPYYPGGLINHINNTRPAGLPANLTLATVQRGTSYLKYDLNRLLSMTLYYNVYPTDWTNTWQPHLQKLATSNSSGLTITTSNLTGGATYSGNQGWAGGVLAPNGNIYFSPYFTTNILVLNPTTGVTSNLTGGATYSAAGWWGGVLAPNGNIYHCPYYAKNFLVLNPTTGVTSNLALSAGITLGDGAFNGGVLAPNGNIYFAPTNATFILALNPTTGVSFTITGGATYTASNGWSGGVLGPDGNIYFAPVSATNILALNPTTGVTWNITGGATYSGSWMGGVLAPNGNIYFAPLDSANILVLNPTTGVTSTISSGSGSGGQKWRGGTLGPNGNIYFSPYAASSILVLNPTTGVASSLTGSASFVNAGCTGNVLGPDGNIYCAPQNATAIIKITFSGLSQLPNSNYCLSAYTNKF